MNYDTFEIEPNLAVSWNFIDAQTVSMVLREGVIFSNGDPLTAYDVQFSIDRAADNPHAAAITGMISHVTVQGTYEFTVHLLENFSPILRHLAHPMAGILPRDHYLEVGHDAFGLAPVGTGPYMLSNWVSGDRVELVVNPNHWGPIPVVQTITWREVPDPSSRLMAVQTGEADVALGVAVADIPVAAADPSVRLLRRQTLGTDYLGFNCEAPYLYSPLVRRAIAYALDTTAIFNAAWGDNGYVGVGPLSSIVWGFANTQPYNTGSQAGNEARARELLAEAGYPDGFNSTIWFNTGNTMRQDVAEMVAAALRPIGIELEVQGLEWSDYLARTEIGEHDMFILGWTTVTGDADYGLHPLFHSTMHGPNNRSRFTYYPLDELLDRGRAETDPAIRLEIYYEAQQMIRDQAPQIFLRQGQEAMAINPAMRNMVINPAGHHYYGRVWFE
jgi:peptide/nickel transport system substrate-binding protein